MKIILTNFTKILYRIAYSACQSKSPTVSKNRKIRFVWEMEAPGDRFLLYSVKLGKNEIFLRTSDPSILALRMFNHDRRSNAIRMVRVFVFPL